MNTVDDADAAWTAQLGPALTEADVARLLGREPGDVAEVVTALTPVLLPLSIASWLTGHSRELDGGRPIDVLRAGDADRVLGLARQLGADAAG